MQWSIAINLVTKESILVRNLVAINEIKSTLEPTEVFTSKDFDKYKLPTNINQLRFIGDTTVELPLVQIKNIKFFQTP